MSCLLIGQVLGLQVPWLARSGTVGFPGAGSRSLAACRGRPTVLLESVSWCWGSGCSPVSSVLSGLFGGHAV
jgi:hypothetical protein